MTVGTPHYISPEQARGEKDLDGARFVFAGRDALPPGEGHTVYQGDNPAVVMAQHISEPLPSLAGLSPGLAKVLTRAMTKKREQRYADATEMLEDWTV